MSELSCEDVIERLFEFLDRELDEPTQREIEHHLELCRGCFSRAEFERRLRQRLSETAEATAPDSLRRRVRLMASKY